MMATLKTVGYPTTNRKRKRNVESTGEAGQRVLAENRTTPCYPNEACVTDAYEDIHEADLALYTPPQADSESENATSGTDVVPQLENLPTVVLKAIAKWLATTDVIAFAGTSSRVRKTLLDSVDPWAVIELPHDKAPRLTDNVFGLLLNRAGLRPKIVDLRGCCNLTSASLKKLHACGTIEHLDIRGCTKIARDIHAPSLLASLSPIFKATSAQSVTAVQYKRLPNTRIEINCAWHGIIRSLDEWKALAEITGQVGLTAPIDFDNEMLVLVAKEGMFPDSFWHKPIPKIQVVADVGNVLAVQVIVPTKGNAGWIDLVRIAKSDKPVAFYFDHQEGWTDVVHRFVLEPAKQIDDIRKHAPRSSPTLTELYTALRKERNPSVRLDMFVAVMAAHKQAQAHKSKNPTYKVRTNRVSARQLSQSLKKGNAAVSTLLDLCTDDVPVDIRAILMREAQCREGRMSEPSRSVKRCRLDTPPRSPNHESSTVKIEFPSVVPSEDDTCSRRAKRVQELSPLARFDATAESVCTNSYALVESDGTMAPEHSEEPTSPSYHDLVHYLQGATHEDVTLMDLMEFSGSFYLEISGVTPSQTISAVTYGANKLHSATLEPLHWADPTSAVPYYYVAVQKNLSSMDKKSNVNYRRLRTRPPELMYDYDSGVLLDSIESSDSQALLTGVLAQSIMRDVKQWRVAVARYKAKKIGLQSVELS